MPNFDITPIMTSDTSPSPYVVSSSSVLNASTSAWKAFNGVNDPAGGCWVSQSGSVKNEWLKIDLSKNTKITGFGISNLTSSGNAYLQSGLKSFKFQGSLNDGEWKDIKEITNEPVWGNKEQRIYNLEKIYNFRYYRILVIENHGYSYAAIDEFKLYYDTDITEEIPNVSHANASLSYTLPMNTTDKILAKTNDQRLGLLGMANDGTNFGDLYVVGRDGKAHLTKGATKGEIIFEGVATKGSYELSRNINEFSFILVFAKVDHRSSDFNGAISDIVYKTEYTDSRYRCMTTYWKAAIYYGIEYALSEDQLRINGCEKGSDSVWANPHIYKIIGVY